MNLFNKPLFNISHVMGTVMGAGRERSICGNSFNSPEPCNHWERYHAPQVTMADKNLSNDRASQM